MLKQRIKYWLFSNKFYKYFIKPFDRILYPVVNASELKEERSENSVPLNKIPNVADLYNRDWMETLEDMKEVFGMDEKSFHRKKWEFNHILYSLKKLGYLYPENKGLAIAAGREQIMYYLAHKISKMVGIDLYEGNYIGGEDEMDIPENPEKYAPFLYPEENLELIKMNALDLELKDNSFDFLFSASSIEHFGDSENIIKSLREMYRVLRPGGAAVITTEIRLNRLACNIPNTRIFKVPDLLNMIEEAGFIISRDEIDIKPEGHYLDNWVKLPEEVYKYPHVILRFFRSIFTSLSIVCIKPGNDVHKGEWKKRTEFPLLKYNGEINVDIDRREYRNGDTAKLKIALKNNGNFKWFSGGMSHRTAIGVKLLDMNGNEVDPGYGEIVIPSDVDMGERIEFQAEIPVKGEPGEYQLLIDLKRELVIWFHEKGSKPFKTKISISKDI
ncbi:MAG: class I SAM-dependent methyltransferase [Acidobacteriota bacterium]